MPLFNLEYRHNEAISYIELVRDSSYPIVEIKKKRKTRTIQQNKALHLFFTQLAKELNDLGIAFNYTGIKGSEMEMQYTGILVKETIWKPIQRALFEIKSTTELDTKQINKILEILGKFFAERGIEIRFPSKIDLIAKEFEKNGVY